MSAEIKEFLSKENLVEYHQIIKDKIDDMTPSNIGVFVDKDEWVLNEEKGKYFNAIPIPGIDESCYPVIGIAPADGESPTEEEIDAYDHITDIITTEGYLTLWCTVEPTTSITIVIKDDLATGGTLIANYSAMVDKINKLETKISELTSNLGKFGTPVDIANTIAQYYGFIPDVDGIVELVINPADTNPAYYVVLSNDGLGGSKSGTWARANSFNGFEASISFPVRAGVAYKKSAAVNCTERIIYIPNK